MKRLEDELRTLLRRRDPPAGFAQRVLRRIEAGESRRARNPLGYLLSRQTPRWLAASLAGILLVIGLSLYQRERRSLEARRDSKQALLALRITGQKLNEALERAARAGRRSADEMDKSDFSEEEP